MKGEYRTILLRQIPENRNREGAIVDRITSDLGSAANRNELFKKCCLSLHGYCCIGVGGDEGGGDGWLYVV